MQHSKVVASDYRCVLLGNGPSLARVDLTGFGSTSVFISNFAIADPKLAKLASAGAVVNRLVAEQLNFDVAAEYQLPVVCPDAIEDSLPEFDLLCVTRTWEGPGFRTDPTAGFSCQSSVSYYLLQLIFWLGYRKVLLAGFDHSYLQPENTQEGEVLFEVGPDLNHYTSTYFQGKYWQAADVDRMEACYENAKTVYVRHSREIIDCTSGGALEVFRKSKLESELESRRIEDPEDASLEGAFRPSRLLAPLFSTFSGRLVSLGHAALFFSVGFFSFTEHSYITVLVLCVLWFSLMASVIFFYQRGRPEQRREQERLQFEIDVLKIKLRRMNGD